MSLHRWATERSLPISLLLLGLFVQACSTESGPTEPLEPAPVTGEILGFVTADGTPVPGVTVTLSLSGSEVATVVTTGNGEFGFRDLGAGTYMVAISEIEGTNCSRQRAATVVAGKETEVEFACVTPPGVETVEVGTVEGRVTVNGVAAEWVLVAMRDGTRHIGTKTTAHDGTYRFTNVPTGDKTVWISTEESCPGTQTENDRRQLEVAVSAGEVAVADFACTGQVVTGRVTVDGIAEPGLKVFVCYGLPVWDYGCVPTPQVTDSEGRYTYTSLRHRGNFYPGEYLLLVEAPPGISCPEGAVVPVPSGVAVAMDFHCVRPAGGGQVVTGRVTVNGIGEPGVRVLVCYGLPVWDFGCVTPLQATDSGGWYAYTSLQGSYLPPGDYVVFVESPLGMSCPEQVRPDVHVSSGETVRVDFACIRSSGEGYWDY